MKDKIILVGGPDHLSGSVLNDPGFQVGTTINAISNTDTVSYIKTSERDENGRTICRFTSTTQTWTSETTTGAR